MYFLPILCFQNRDWSALVVSVTDTRPSFVAVGRSWGGTENAGA